MIRMDPLLPACRVVPLDVPRFQDFQLGDHLVPYYVLAVAGLVHAIYVLILCPAVRFHESVS